MDEAANNAVLRKVAFRLIPFLFLLYVINILDRVNVGFAKLTMLKDLHIEDPRIFGFCAGIFYLGYVLFEVPSNLILRRTGARRWIARILVSWGLVSCAMMFIQGPWTFGSLRVLLGIAESGFFPGIILYMTYWFPTRQRARIVALLMIGSPVTAAIGNPLSGLIMQDLNGVIGLAGWQWLFLIEGIPAVILGFIALRFLTDRPEHATWLTHTERTWLAEEIAREEKHRATRHDLDLRRALLDERVWLLCTLYFTLAVGANAYGFYLPTFVARRFPGLDESRIGLLAAIPGICAILGMVVNGIHSDRTGERRWHIAVPACIGAFGLLCYAFTDSPVLGLVGLAVAQAGIQSTLPVFWALPTAFLSGVAAAGGIALINSLGNLGGFVGPNFISLLEQPKGNFTPGLAAVATALCFGAVLAMCVRREHAADRPPTEPAQ